MKQYEIWLANLSPSFGTEPGKTRPVVIIQNDVLFQHGHQSTLVCPMTTSLSNGAQLLRTRVPKSSTGLLTESDILIDQIRAVDNRRFIKIIGHLPLPVIRILRQNIMHILDIDDM